MTAEAVTVAATGGAALLVTLTFQVFLRLGRRHQAAALEEFRPGEIDTLAYQVGPHLHVIDYDRSLLEVMENGAIIAHCCRVGCDESVVIGRGVVERMTEEGLKL